MPDCPDCGQPESSHELYPEGRCPVVRFEAPLRDLFSQLPQAEGELLHLWDEDTFVPYTPYDRARDVAAFRRLEFRRRLDPPIP